MLVDLSHNEEEILNSIRDSEKYKAGNFGKSYISAFAELRRVVEAAKIYVLDNYQKVDDYSDLHLMLNCVNHKEKVYFGQKSKRPRKKKGEKESALDRMIKEIDKQTIEIKTFDKAVYDWTDGDFSVVFNGVDYNWIDSNSIVDIAAYIEGKIGEVKK
jgi:hypothetical protein